MTEVREPVHPEALNLPPCALPRPGEAVVWYQGGQRIRGTLFGHAPGGKPVVTNEYGYSQVLGTYDEVRLQNPTVRLGPSWTSLGAGARLVRPSASEREAFNRILSERMPPGPTYLELVEEISARGFETCLVGGTVRDVLSGSGTKDVDLVTSMPLEPARTLLARMYRGDPQIHRENGFVRLGGTPASGDPFIDLKSFVRANPGTPYAVFGSDFVLDLSYRDFSCNAIYYDPINGVLIDPSGHGIECAENKTLRVVCDGGRPAFHKAQILIRFFKFLCRGYLPTEDTTALMRDQYLSALPAMRRGLLVSYMQAQLFSKAPRPERSQILIRLQEVVVEHAGEATWRDYIEPAAKQFASGTEV